MKEWGRLFTSVGSIDYADWIGVDFFSMFMFDDIAEMVGIKKCYRFHYSLPKAIERYEFYILPYNKECIKIIEHLSDDRVMKLYITKTKRILLLEDKSYEHPNDQLTFETLF